MIYTCEGVPPAMCRGGVGARRKPDPSPPRPHARSVREGATLNWHITFSQPCKEKCINEIVRIGSVIIFHLSKLRKAKFLILCDESFWWGCRGNYQLITLVSWTVKRASYPCIRGPVDECRELSTNHWSTSAISYLTGPGPPSYTTVSSCMTYSLRGTAPYQILAAFNIVSTATGQDRLVPCSIFIAALHLSAWKRWLLIETLLCKERGDWPHEF